MSDWIWQHFVGLTAKMTLGKAYQAIFITRKFFCKAVAIPPSTTPSAFPVYRGTFVVSIVYLKRQAIQLAIEWRTSPLKEHK